MERNSGFHVFHVKRYNFNSFMFFFCIYVLLIHLQTIINIANCEGRDIIYIGFSFIRLHATTRVPSLQFYKNALLGMVLTFILGLVVK